MKYILPFIGNTYQTNHHCPLCNDIDRLFNSLQDKDITLVQDKIEHIETLLVDGYKILHVLEGLNYTDQEVSMIQQYSLLKNIEPGTVARYNYFVNNDELFYDSMDDLPTTLYSRWCSICGARKFDIYDTLRKERMDLLPITNFFIKLPSLTEDDLYTDMYIKWRDSGTDQFDHSELVINDNVVLKSVQRNEYADDYYIYTIKTNVLYAIYIVNYDKFNHELTRTPLKYIIAESDNKPIPLEIADLTVKEETRLVRQNSQYIREKLININYTPTSEYTAIRMAEKDEPGDINTGIPIENNQIVVSDEDIRLWCIKPFPGSELRARKVNKSYQLYRDYNNESSPAYIQLSRLANEPSLMSAKPSDRSIYLNWSDPLYNWSRTDVYIKEAELINREKPNEAYSKDFLHNYPKVYEDYIMNIHGGKLIYSNDILKKHRDESYKICTENGYELINGHQYQVALVSVNKNGTSTIPTRQFNVMPQYIRPSYKLDYQNRLTHMDNCLFENEYLVTYKPTTCFYVAQYELIEGAFLKFNISSNYPIKLKIWTNQANIFDEYIHGNEQYRYKEIKLEIPKMSYCKIILNISSPYKQMHVKIKDFELIYKPYSYYSI